jgi:hypothetical protein
MEEADRQQHRRGRQLNIVTAPPKTYRRRTSHHQGKSNNILH